MIRLVFIFILFVNNIIVDPFREAEMPANGISLNK